VQHAAPLDFGAIMSASNQQARAAVREQFKSLVDYYPALERLQTTTVQNYGTMLSEEGGMLYSWVQNSKAAQRKGKPEWEKIVVGKANPNIYTGKARQAVEQAMEARGPITLQGDQLKAIGDFISEQALLSYAESGPTEIETELGRQAMNDLTLGRSLSAEQQREATQAARASMNQRGLGTSMATSAAEILNRDAMASQREADRRNFAASANQMLVANQMGRRDQAAQQAALGSTVSGNAAQIYGQAAGLGLEGAGAFLRTDPVQRAMAPGIAAAGQNFATAGNIIGPTYGNAMNAGLGVASFNANMLDTRANSQLNNWAAMQAAQMGAGASRQAGMMGMIGGIGGGLLGGAGFALSDKREKKDIKPLGKAGSVLGLTAYEYKYKGEDKKHKGFMAQDVQKVLPEAVTEVDYKGKKRLAIKPAVIGAALAEELMTAKAA
jgi:hypothetical protein